MGLFGNTGGLTPAKTVNLVKNPQGASAVDLTKVREAGHIDLAKRADKAGIALSKRGLAGIRAEAILVLDHSGSMYQDYANGNVQTLVERALGFALQIDVNGIVPVIPFDGRILPVVNVDQSNYQGVVASTIWRGRDMGSTDLASALEAALKLVQAAPEPVFLIVVTDGAPDNAAKATKVICELSRYPVFVKFLALRPVDYLTTLDKLGDDKRLLDNVNAQPDADDPNPIDLLACTDLQFAEAMAQEWDEWVTKAQKAGILS